MSARPPHRNPWLYAALAAVLICAAGAIYLLHWQGYIYAPALSPFKSGLVAASAIDDEYREKLPNGWAQDVEPLVVEEYSFEHDEPILQKISFASDTSPIIVIIPHPDDEAFAMSSMLANYAAAGVNIRVYLLNDGEDSAQAEGWISKHANDGDLNDDGTVDARDFGLARRGEFSSSLETIGIDTGEIVFLGNAEGDSFLQNNYTPERIQEAVEADLAKNNLSVTPDTRLFTVSPVLGSDGKALFYGEGPDEKTAEQPLHAMTTRAVAELGADNPSHVYFFKVYAQQPYAQKPSAPLEYHANNESFAARKEAHEAYRKIGFSSVRRLYQASIHSSVEYCSTLEQIQDAGYDFP